MAVHAKLLFTDANFTLASLRRSCLVLFALFLTALPAGAQKAIQLEAEEVARFPASQAVQGAAADSRYFYAVENSAIGRYDKETGEEDGEWSLSDSGPIRHLNSCIVDLDRERLLCANSNFPELPMASSIEVFDTQAMEHVDSHSLGLTDGSLVWFDRHGEDWIAGFAHYDSTGGVPHKDHRYTRVVHYDVDWTEQGGWMLPESVLERLAPYSTSGGGIGPDSLLYLTGHDREEMYVLVFPEQGPKLVHLATIDIALQGQAFAWDRSTDERVVWGISRPNGEVRAFRIPGIPTDRAR